MSASGGVVSGSVSVTRFGDLRPHLVMSGAVVPRASGVAVLGFSYSGWVCMWVGG